MFALPLSISPAVAQLKNGIGIVLGAIRVGGVAGHGGVVGILQAGEGTGSPGLLLGLLLSFDMRILDALLERSHCRAAAMASKGGMVPGC